MSAFFVVASTQYLLNSAPFVLAYPFSVGGWVKMTAVSASAQIIWIHSDTATTNNYFRVGITATEVLTCTAAGGGTGNNASLTTPLVAGEWAYFVARFISATNRRISGLYQSGATEHAATATSRSPAGMDASSIGAHFDSAGASFPWGGNIAELWHTSTDIQADGAQLLDSTLRQLAYGGPFSIPHIAKDIVEYRSLKKDPLTGNAWDIYSSKGTQTWANTNGVTIGPHPPLPSSYKSWEDFRRTLVI